MPFTPFHLGAALLVKPVAPRRVSLITFGLAQILIDIEPLIALQLNRDVLHGYSHTLPGAVVVAAVTVWLARRIVPPVQGRVNRELQHYGLTWLRQDERLSLRLGWSTALFGTLSHLVLDSLMHADIRPFYPLSDANPLLDLVAPATVYLACLLAIVAGCVAWVVRAWWSRQPG